MSRTKTILLSLAGGAAGLLAAGVAYQFFGLRRDRRTFQKPGKMVHHLHIHDSGTGAPAVVLESGIAASSLSWRLVQPEVAQLTRVCSYDRAGLGWSEHSVRPASLCAMVTELRTALAAIELPRPVILVGHSFGGLIVRAYAAWYPEEVAGLILIDPVLPADWIDIAPEQARTLATGVKLSRRGAILARTGVVRLALASLSSGARRLPQWVAHASSGKGSSVATRLVNEVRKLPPELWPVIRAHWSDPKSFDGMARHLAILPASAKVVGELRLPENTSVTILSAANATLAQTAEWDRMGTHIRVAEAGHWIQFDNPQLVIEVIKRMVLQVRGAHPNGV